MRPRRTKRCVLFVVDLAEIRPASLPFLRASQVCDRTSLKCGLSLCANMVQRSASRGGAKPGWPYKGAGDWQKARKFRSPFAGMISILSLFSLIAYLCFVEPGVAPW